MSWRGFLQQGTALRGEQTQAIAHAGVTTARGVMVAPAN
jgi:hypothetical protein